MTRLSININDETAASLQSQLPAVSVTERVRRAVALYGFLDAAMQRGERIRLIDRDGSVRELVPVVGSGL